MICIKTKKLIVILLVLVPACMLGNNRIIISKQQMQLYVVNEVQDTIFQCPIACGMTVVVEPDKEQ